MRIGHAVTAALALIGCESANRSAPAPAPERAPAAPDAAPVAAAPPDAAPPRSGDREGVPDVGPTPICTPGGGDPRPLTDRLAVLARGAEAAPPPADELLDGCLAPPATIVDALLRGGRQLAKRRAWGAAAAYARTAIEVDPSSPDARVALAVARTQLADFAGALYQLGQWRVIGKGAVQDLLRDRGLAPLRERRSFWRWAGVPLALPRALADEARGSWEPRTSAVLAIPELGPDDPDQMFARVKLKPATLRALAAAVSDAGGRPFTDVHVATADDLEPLDFGARGFTLLSAPAVVRLTDGPRMLAVTLTGDFDAYDANVAILAVEQSPGQFAIAKLLNSRLGCNCDDSALRVSSDHRALGWFTFCQAGDAETYERCVLHADGDRLVTRCETKPGNSEELEGVEWRSCTASDGELKDYPEPW